MLDTAPYYLILLMAAAPALSSGMKMPGIGWTLFGIILLIFVGLRHEVGGDWEGYLMIADRLRDQTFIGLFEHGEVAFNFIVWASVHLGLDIYGANVVTTALFLFGLFKYCKKQVNPWLAIFTALPFLVIVIAMSANRQAAAIGITLLVLAGWNESSVYKKILWIFFAGMFHTSAIIFVVFIIIDSKISLFKKLMLSAVLFLTVTVFLSGNEAVSRYENSYIVESNTNFAAGALQQIILNAFPALIFLIMSRKRHFRNEIPYWNIIFFMSVLSIILIPVSFSYSVLAARVSFYFFPVSIFFFATIPEIFHASVKDLLKFLVVCYGFLTFALWINFANTAFAHIPYNNLLFIFD